MCDWPEDTTLRFLEAYKNEPCIWNSKDPYHKNRHKVQDAWTRLSVIMKKNVKELKHKKEILMATFRRHCRKQQASIRSGAGADDIYKPNWFAYDQMESFLGPFYTCTDNVNTEEEVPPQEIPIESTTLAEEEQDIEDSDLEQPSTSQTPKLLIPRRRPATNVADRQMTSAFRQLTNILTKRQKDRYQPPPKDDDDCDLYAKLLAKKLRELPPDDRTLMMYDIDTLFVNRIKNKMCQTLSSYHSVPYEMQIASPRIKRSSTSQTSYSEPLANASPEPPI
ncbi:uncharacterized protein LOC111352623 [Spodoptera litura]|uniref:Uncharacterized protein LOC111352623 n=1 Tax=Spodoptera litura TaxID=69820 RepID=A0A9J7DZ65_SPOLT|nr:uncharacterized protein LOC111352623 [Spodoptera litura]